MSRLIKIAFTIVFLTVLIACFGYKIFSSKSSVVSKSMGMKKFFNVVLFGAAGSGKGTQGDIIKGKMNLLQVSAGEVLRQYRKNPNAKYTKVINDYIDKGQLVPSEITNELIAEHIRNNVFCDGCVYDGVIYDGFPRQVGQLEFLDNFLKDNGNKVDAVVYIDVPMEDLVDRLSGRFACSDCGELYHKKTKPTKVSGVCDKCGSTRFSVRADDQDVNAIKERFKIFLETTMPVLNVYNSRGIVIKVDGTRSPKEIGDEILVKLGKIKKSQQ